MSLEYVGQSSAQAKQYLLCHECEQRLNHNGEKWVSANCYHTQRNMFRLRQLLAAATPILSGPQGGAYDASQVEKIRIDKLVYFGASVVWRASLRSWRIQKYVYGPNELGAKIQEELRLYLLGEGPFPSDAVSCVYISTLATPQLSIGFPEALPEENSNLLYRFYIPGLWFFLLVGENLTEDNRKMCILRSPFHPLCLYVGADALAHSIAYRLYMHDKHR
jgi:hypothetical protein